VWYEFDIRIDGNGNPHFVMSLTPKSSDDGFIFGYDIAGYYHFTIDLNFIDDPGPINTPTGWNWSHIPFPAHDSFQWMKPDGFSYVYGYPYAIWNEFTQNTGFDGCPGGSYGGRPYFSFDEFGYGGESWHAPVDIDVSWDCSLDLWEGSVGYGYDEANDEGHVIAVYNDWSANNASYLFKSEFVEDGYIIFEPNTLIVNPQYFAPLNYSTDVAVSMNDNGQGVLGMMGVFAGGGYDGGGCDPPASNLSCYKSPKFKAPTSPDQLAP
jgi:hypothetical protein